MIDDKSITPIIESLHFGTPLVHFWSDVGTLDLRNMSILITKGSLKQSTTGAPKPWPS
jgi:hypothetical protein